NVIWRSRKGENELVCLRVTDSSARWTAGNQTIAHLTQQVVGGLGAKGLVDEPQMRNAEGQNGQLAVLADAAEHLLQAIQQQTTIRQPGERTEVGGMLETVAQPVQLVTSSDFIFQQVAELAELATPGCIKLPRRVVKHAQSTQRLVARTAHHSAGVETDVGWPGDQGIVGEAHILACIRHDHDIFIAESVSAERDVPADLSLVD